MKKKFIFGLTAVTLALCLSACGNSKTEENAGIDTENTEETTVQYESAGSLADFTGLPQLQGVKSGDTIATFHTNKGDIKVWFFPDYAPKAVENFVTHAQEGYYNGLTFHRVINEFMIQGGDPNGNGTGGESIWGAPFENEVSLDLRNIRGALCMANAGPDTNGSQFYIVQNANGADMQSMLNESDKTQPYVLSGSNKVFQNSKGENLTVGDVFPQEVIDAYGQGGYAPLDLSYTVFGQVYEGMDIVDAIAAVQTDESDKPVEDIIIESVEVGTY